MTVTASAAGTRIDCDRCGRHVGSRVVGADALRRLTEYAHHDGRDYCPDCAFPPTSVQRGVRPDRFARRGSSTAAVLG